MTQNNLFLNRLRIITKENLIAYDEKFHSGVNIICGENSSGKSTITHFIFYALGGSFNDWVKEARNCSVVYAEVRMNELTFTIRREINISEKTKKANSNESLRIFWGLMDDAVKAGIEDWMSFPYNTSPDKKSFSNIFFETLGLPVVRGDSNITFHQILRLLYLDQESPTSSLFYYEKFDTTLTRSTVADLLLGVYSQDLYDFKQRLNEAVKEHEQLKNEIKVIKQFVPNELNLFPEHLKTAIKNKEEEIVVIHSQIQELQLTSKKVNYGKNTKLEFEKLNHTAIVQRTLIKKLDEVISEMELEIADTKYFIESLQSKEIAIKNSISTRHFLGEFPLDYCPECLEPLKYSNTHGECKLCKENIENSHGILQAKKIELELSFQIKESTNIKTSRERKLLDLKAKRENEKVNLHHVQQQVNVALKDVKSVKDEKIENLLVEKGFVEGVILQLRTLLEHAEVYQSLFKRKSELEAEINYLQLTIDSIELNQTRLKEEINSKIEKKGVYLLNNDLHRQDEFIFAKKFIIDYGNNIAFLKDKEAKYSASSNFYLKSVARFSIFLASLEIKRMRYPRFILSDNMEDKGIEEIRALNFQKLIIAEAERSEVDYQVIYTTSYIPLDLKIPKYTVGEFYTKKSRSLKNIKIE